MRSPDRPFGSLGCAGRDDAPFGRRRPHSSAASGPDRLSPRPRPDARGGQPGRPELPMPLRRLFSRTSWRPRRSSMPRPLPAQTSPRYTSPLVPSPRPPQTLGFSHRLLLGAPRRPRLSPRRRGSPRVTFLVSAGLRFGFPPPALLGTSRCPRGFLPVGPKITDLAPRRLGGLWPTGAAAPRRQRLQCHNASSWPLS